MDEKIIFVDLIDGAIGTFQGFVENSQSKLVVPLYKPNGLKGLLPKIKFRNGSLEVPERQLVFVRTSQSFPGQSSQICFLIPTTELKDVTYENTVYNKIFVNSNLRLEEQENKLSTMRAKCASLERNLMDEKRKNNSINNKSNSTQVGIPCKSCGTRSSIDNINAADGKCPSCGESMIKGKDKNKGAIYG